MAHRQDEIDVGCFVSWNDNDEDVPEGSVGEVTGWKDDTRVHIEFPNGNWHFPIDELTLIDKPKRKRDGAEEGPRAWRPRQRQFESWVNAIDTEAVPLQTIAKDAVTLNNVTRGRWMWIGAQEQPRCTLEHFAQEVFRFHTQGADPTELVCGAGAEFRVEMQRRVPTGDERGDEGEGVKHEIFDF